ncbi:DNA topoisomerase III [Erysipelotrichaceae bacterium]|nr:DNA topoisomerase III [Erysipelotrichaceae bacterium]
MKAVVLAEKPSVARDIARVLGCSKKGDGYLEGNKYIVTWALGHLVTLADPEFYNKKYKAWNLEDLPMMPDNMQTVIMPKTAKQYHAVAKQLKRNDVNEIIIATDAGREGELVARLIMKESKVKKPYRRLWISSVTDKAIRDGFAKLQDGKKYDNLYYSAFARASADWYVGMNATRALTTKYNAQLSSGRVQTPTLAMIALREQEIKSFRSRKYFGIQALAHNIVFTWKDLKTNLANSFDEQYITDKVKELQGSSLSIKDVKKQGKKTPASLLYDLTELQRDANKKYGMSAKQTLSAMQGLYEQHKMLTYPRTDSRYISHDIVPTLKDRITAAGVGEYATTANLILKTPIKIMSMAVNDEKVSDHHAIIPTEQRANLSALSDMERKIYSLVVRRFFAVLLPSFEYEETIITAAVGLESFSAKGKRILKKGWKVAYSDEDEKDQLLPEIKIGQTLKIDSISRTSGVTTPPAHLTEATLLSAMEKPSKYMSGLSAQVIKQLDEAGGLGTVATRADIIEKLFGSFVIEKKDQAIHITPKGIQLLSLAPEKLCSPVLTAQWEGQLTKIASGALPAAVFIKNIKEYTSELVQEIKSSSAVFKHQNISSKSCPTCSMPMLEVTGKKGKMLVCSDRECGTRQNVSMVTNARCPECKKKLEMFGEGDGRIFVCRCGYREKLSSFEKRRAQESNTKAATKSEVQNFLKKQQKEEPPIANAFAKAFGSLKNK